jgi:hypothetical protein
VGSLVLKKKMSKVAEFDPNVFVIALAVETSVLELVLTLMLEKPALALPLLLVVVADALTKAAE